MNTTKIEEWIDLEEFKELISNHKSNILVSPHALTHLSIAQRLIFNESELINPIMNERPEKVGKQRNGRYAAFYHRKNGYLKIILERKTQKLEIITFINVDIVPSITKKND